MKLDLQELRELSVIRAVCGFKCYDNVPVTYWTTAIAGELGELCNMIKKLERVGSGGIDGGSSYTAKDITKDMMEEEIGGIAIYLDLLASKLGISLEDAIIKTFNSKSEKYNFKQFLTPVTAKKPVDPQEIWDDHSELVGTDIDELDRIAGSEVMVKAQFNKLVSKHEIIPIP
jgi:NTP pyrophosphatase (non-canonical NTP hydrolase)